MKPFTEEDRYVYDLKPDSMVVDAGAYRGDFTAEMLQRYGCAIIALEPIKQYYESVKERFKNNPMVKVCNWGLGWSDGPARMFIHGDSTGEFAGGQEWERVYLSGIVTFLDSEVGYTGQRKVDVLKLNIEGGEFDVLEKLISLQPCGRLHKIRNIQVQFHPVVPQYAKRYADIRESLLKTHHLTFDEPWCWENYQLND